MRRWQKFMEYARNSTLVAALLAGISPALAVDVTAGNRTVSVPIPDGYANLADISPQWVAQFYGFVSPDELPLLILVADTVTGQDAAWTTTTAYAIVSVIRSSLGGTLGTPEFVAQTDFASNGIRDASRLTEAQAALLVSEALTEDDSPLAFAPESPNAINGMQLLAVTERTETTAALTIAHPTADYRLLLNDLGFVNVDGQLFKVAAFAVLREEGTIASLQAFGKSVRDGILGAN